LTTLRTPYISPLKITSVYHVHPRRRSSYKIRKSQKQGIPKLITPLSTTIKIEELKDSPGPEKIEEI
jgi:hypothetical protein